MQNSPDLLLETRRVAVLTQAYTDLEYHLKESERTATVLWRQIGLLEEPMGLISAYIRQAIAELNNSPVAVLEEALKDDS